MNTQNNDHQGYCFRCGQVIEVRPDGNFYYHRSPSGRECMGSHQPCSPKYLRDEDEKVKS